MATLCEKFETFDVNQGQYIIQNNVWGASTEQHIEASSTSTYFEITRAEHSHAISSLPASYPSIFRGCYWGNCTRSTDLPAQVSAIECARSSWRFRVPNSGAWNATYDLWFDSSPEQRGQPDEAELMIWLDSRGDIRPAGRQVATVTIDGAPYDVWYTDILDWNYVAYQRVIHTTSVSNLRIDAFIGDAVARGYIDPSSYLLAIGAGFELWQGGAGLTTESFSASVNDGCAVPARLPAS